MNVREPYESDPEISEAAGWVVLLFMSKKLGGIVSYADIARASGYTGNSEVVKSRLVYIIAKTRKLLLDEFGIVCRCERKTGVVMLTDAEQVERCFKERTKKTFRQYGYAHKEISNADGSKLTDHERRSKVMKCIELTANRTSSRKALKRAAAYKKTETLPIRRIPNS